MKRFLQFCVVLLVSLSAAALEDSHAKYVGGTLPSATAGVVGRLDTTPEMSLVFLHAGNRVEIPYASIESYEYSKEVARHLGVLPMIAIGLIKMRQHRHFFRITYRAPGSAVPQVAIFEVPKHMPRTLQAVLDARAPHTDKSCKPCLSSNSQY